MKKNETKSERDNVEREPEQERECETEKGDLNQVLSQSIQKIKRPVLPLLQKISSTTFPFIYSKMKKLFIINQNINHFYIKKCFLIL